MLSVAGYQLVSVSQLHASRLQVPAETAGDVTSLVGHVVGVFSPHLNALCDAYNTYLAGLSLASDTLRQLTETNETLAHYVDVRIFSCLLYINFLVNQDFHVWQI